MSIDTERHAQRVIKVWLKLIQESRSNSLIVASSRFNFFAQAAQRLQCSTMPRQKQRNQHQ